MNFVEFQTFRESLLRERPDICDCAETNLYRALARLSPPPTPAPSQRVHRCHLASEWCARFGFPLEASRRALISCGVRDSLARLFRHCAERKVRIWLPSDNYPVYGELARQAGCEFRQFPTLPAPRWPDETPVAGDEVLLITCPLKPLGRGLNDSDANALKRWLAASPQRRLWLDAVYTFDTRFDAAAQQLLATGQTILLHSLTKGWLQPRLFGISLVPANDAPALAPFFRADAPPQKNLARARECLGLYAETPAAVAEALSAAKSSMINRTPLSVMKGFSALDAEESVAGYFLPVRAPWRALLDAHSLLGIPATAFGSSRTNITILSTLSFAR